MKNAESVPKIAIITRTKNRPAFLNRAVKSVLSQTYADYIHVILNDGGDKGVVERILSEQPDERRLVIHNPKSVGIVAALNQAIKASRSDFVVIHDDDDSWHSRRLEIGIGNIEERGAKANAVPMQIVIEDIDSDGKPIEVERMPHPESWCGEISLYKQAHRNYLSNGAIMYARGVYDELGGYNEDLPTAEDWDFGIRLMLKWDVEQVISNEALVYYHQRPKVIDRTIGNSVHAGVREQERAIMLIRNSYLRDDLKRGVLGVGYIMNDIEQGLNNVVRLEGHINRNIDTILDGIKLTKQEVRRQSLYYRIKSLFRD